MIKATPWDSVKESTEQFTEQEKELIEEGFKRFHEAKNSNPKITKHSQGPFVSGHEWEKTLEDGTKVARINERDDTPGGKAREEDIHIEFPDGSELSYSDWDRKIYRFRFAH